MKIEDQVCTLEQAKRLYVLGVKDGSYFFWHRGAIRDEWVLINWEQSHIGVDDFSAYTVAELGGMLPHGQFLTGYQLMDNWGCGWYPDRDYGDKVCKHSVHSNTEAQARALMLIYLLENKHITPEEINQRLNQ